MNWWNFSISDWSIEKIRAREKCARKILLFNAKLQDAKLETLLQKAFDEGMQLFEFDGNFFLRFNPATKRLIKTFNSPLNNVMTFTDDVDYTEKVTSILACLIPDGESVTFVDIAKTVEAIGQYRRKLLLPNMKALMFDDSGQRSEFDSLWQKLFEAGKKFDGNKMVNALQFIRYEGAILGKSERWGIVIDTDNLNPDAKLIYDKKIKPYLMFHKEWLVRILKNLLSKR